MYRRVLIIVLICMGALASLGFSLAPTQMQPSLESTLAQAPANTAPQVTGIPNATVAEGATFAVGIMAIDADMTSTLAIDVDAGVLNTILSATVNMTHAAGVTATAQLQIVTTEADGGSTYPITVTVTDDDVPVNVVTTTFGLTVTEVNVTPTLMVADQTISETQTLSFTVMGADVDVPAGPLTYTIVASTTDSAEIDPASGLFTWLPTEAEGGSNFNVTVALSDGALTATESFTITVIDYNEPPYIPPVATQPVNEMSPISFTVSVTDTDLPADALVVSAVSLPPDATFNPVSGLFEWTPTEAHGGNVFTATIAVTDGALTTTRMIPITVIETNLAPQITPIAAQQVSETVQISFTLTVTDADLPANNLTVSVLNAPSNATFDANSGLFEWTPLESQAPDVITVTFSVSDGVATTLLDVPITTYEVNQAPILAALLDQNVIPLSPLQLTALASDADVPSNGLSYALANPPAGVTIGTSTGVINWAAVPTGTHQITVTVQDNGVPPLSDQAVFTVTAELSTLYLPLVTVEYAPFSNGGFENGTLAGWETGGTIRAGVATSLDVDGSTGSESIAPIAGSYSAHLGDPAYGTSGSPSGFSELRRTITLPSDTTRLQLSYRIFTHDRIFGTTLYFDTFEVYVNGTAVTELVRDTRCRANPGVVGSASSQLVLCDGNVGAASRNNPPLDVGLKSAEIDLTAYAGTNIELILRVYNRVDSLYNTWVYVDEIAILP